MYRAILGRNTGKFRPNPQDFFPINQKIILIDTALGSLMNVAMQVPHLNTVISTGAKLFSQMKIKHLNRDGEEVKDSKVLKFLKKPNPLQTHRQYLSEFYVLNAVYNKTFQYKIQGLPSPLQRIPDAMWILPSGYMKINTTGKLYRQTSLKDIIVNYEMMGDPFTYDVDKVIYMAEGIGNNILNPKSRIEALQIPLSNIVASMKSNNIIITEKGLIGFISPDAPKSDSDGVLPYTPEEHARVRAEFQNQYSLDSMGGHVAFPKSSLKWVPMTMDVKQLGLNETTEDAFCQVIAAYGHDRDIYPSTKGATYENKAAGMKSTVQNGCQPLADVYVEQLADNLIDESTGEYLEASYEDLPCMKEDERLAAQGKLYTVQANSQALADNVISHEQYALNCDFDMDGTAETPQIRPALGNLPTNPKPE